MKRKLIGIRGKIRCSGKDIKGQVKQKGAEDDLN